MTSDNCRGGTLPGAGEAHWVVLLAVAWLTWDAIAFAGPAAHGLAVPTAYGLVLVLLGGFLLSARLMRSGRISLPPRPFLVGAGFAVAGASFDIFATVLHTPDLSNEQNPYARALLDSGHPLTFVYVYCWICNWAHQAIVVLLWAALLRHRETIVGQYKYCSLCRAATRHGRSWLASFRSAYFPVMYGLVWPLAVISVAGGAYRWYLGLEWFGVFVGHGTHVAAVSGLIGVAVYCTWVRRAVRAPEAGEIVDRRSIRANWRTATAAEG